MIAYLIEEAVEVNMENASIPFFKQDVLSMSIPKPAIPVSKEH